MHRHSATGPALDWTIGSNCSVDVRRDSDGAPKKLELRHFLS
jgi:hypothetical protein